MLKIVFSILTAFVLCTATGSSISEQPEFHPPVGILNKGNYCYMSSLIQVLFHLPTVRDLVLNYDSNSLAHATLASLFYRLMTGETAQDMDVEFFPAVRGLIEADQISHAFRPGSIDDAHAFYAWLLDRHLTWILKELFTVQIKEWLSYDGVEFAHRISTESAIFVKVLEAPNEAVHKSLSEAKEVIEYTINPQEYEGIYSPDDFEREKDIKTLFMEAGITEKTPTKTTIKHTMVINTPPILVIHASKSGFNRETFAETWDFATKTVYDPAFQLNGKTYHLHGIIVSQPLHYWAHVCVDTATNTWYKLNDERATKSSPDANIGNSPYMLFYVEESLRDKWVEQGRPDANKVPDKYKVAGQLNDSLVTLVRLLSDLTGQEFPRDELQISINPPAQNIVAQEIVVSA